DSTDADGARAGPVADDADVRIELPLDTVEGAHFFAGLRAAHHNSVVADLVVIKCVQRVAEFQHHIIRNVHDIADARNARSFQTVFQPFWRRLNLHAAHYASREAAAKFH